jgi:hypothetical protein
MYFVEIQDNQPVASGRVGPQINQDYVFVQYDSPRKFARTVNMAQFNSFALFKTPEELQAFVSPPKPVVPAGTPEEIIGDSIDVTEDEE